MKLSLTHKFGLAVLSAILVLVSVAAVQAQETTNQPAVPKPVVIKRGQISGISDDVVTVVYTEGRRKVYDPVLVTSDTAIWWGKKTVGPSSLRLRQYLKVTGERQAETILAQRIDILSGVPVVKQPVVVKKSAKAAVKAPIKTVVKQPAKVVTKKPVKAAADKKQIK